MPRVQKVKAGKDYPHFGIVKGQEHYVWKPGYGGPTLRSLTPPRPSQLTTSKWSAVYAAREAIEDCTSWEALTDEVQLALEVIEETSGEYEDAAAEMEGVEAHQTRADHLQDLLSELQNVDLEEEIECPECRSEGTVECPECLGERSIGETGECDECGGTGEITDEEDDSGNEPCSACDGTGQVPLECSRCGGMGTLDCSTCEGTGYLEPSNDAFDGTGVLADHLEEVKDALLAADWDDPV